MVDPMTMMAVGQGIAGLIQSFGAGRKAKQARREAERAESRLRALEANRQEIINPYANVKDLSSMVTNPFANLQVATQAAELQAAETDISLASTLDTLRATGQGAGGATALAQAASRAKQGISADIERQEAANAMARDQGESQMQQLRMSEAARVQGLEAAGQQFMFSARETREMQQLDRQAGLAEQFRMIEAGQREASSAGIGSFFGAAAGLGASYLGGTNPFTGQATGKNLGGNADLLKLNIYNQ